MKRYSMNRGKDRRVFSRTADNVHWVNYLFYAPMRGGRRL